MLCALCDLKNSKWHASLPRFIAVPKFLSLLCSSPELSCLGLASSAGLGSTKRFGFPACILWWRWFSLLLTAFLKYKVNELLLMTWLEKWLNWWWRRVFHAGRVRPRSHVALDDHGWCPFPVLSAAITEVQQFSALEVTGCCWFWAWIYPSSKPCSVQGFRAPWECVSICREHDLASASLCLDRLEYLVAPL